MSGFSGLGIGSGLDLNTLVTGLVRAEREPVENRINRSSTRARTTLSALGALKSAVTRLDEAVASLANYTPGMRASSSDPAIVGVSVQDGAAAASWQVRVLELASARSLASEPFADSDEAVGSGTLLLQAGDDEVALDFDGDATLADVVDAINSSGLAAQATLVRDGDQTRLLLTSGRTGAASQVSIAVSGGLDGRLATAQMQETVPGRDAVFVVNGLQVSSPSNEIDNVLPGVSLSLRAVTEGQDAVTVRVEADRQRLKSLVDTMLTAWNALVDHGRTAGRADPEGGASGPLVGDATLRALQSRLAGAFSMSLNPGDGSSDFSMMLDLGISTDVNGRASLDAARFEQAFAEDRIGVEALVQAFGERMSSTLSGFTGNAGALSGRTESLNAQLRRLDQQRESLNRRMEQLEVRLRAQFSALDSLLAQFQSTSQYLAQQLSAISGMQSGGR